MGNEQLFLLYDTDSPLAKVLSDGYITALHELQMLYPDAIIESREFTCPPQPLYRGGMINPENPHAKEQNRVITSHNITENINIGLDHHKKIEVTSEEIVSIDPQIESIKNSLTSLPKNSIVVLIQSTNFRLSTFRIRLELFHRDIHVVEHNHLAYIKESEFDTFMNSLVYRTDEYVRLEHEFSRLSNESQETKILSNNGSILTF